MAFCGSCRGRRREFLAPLDVRKIPGVGKVTEKNLHACGIRKVGDLAALEDAFLQERFGKWGLALAGKARGEDAGGWFDGEMRAKGGDPKSISHEHTFIGGHARTRRRSTRCWCGSRKWSRGGCAIIGCTRARCRSSCAIRIFRRLRGRGRWITRRRSTTEIADAARELFHKAWTGKPIRLLGVYAQSLEAGEGQTSLLDEGKTERWRKTLEAVDQDARQIRRRHGVAGGGIEGGVSRAGA